MSQRHRVAIIGSGPAGLSAAAHAAALGIDHVLIEKAPHLADTIHRYQKGKHVMATPAQLALRADLPFDAAPREAILAGWAAAAAAAGVNLMLGAEVTGIGGSEGDFAIALADGRRLQAERIVLAIGTQGNRTMLDCPIAADAVVQYTLDDPSAYIDEHVVVIGGGDSAIENALGLVADPAQRNRVILVHHAAEFPTAREANVAALLAAEADGRVAVLRDTAVAAIEHKRVRLDARDGAMELACDRVIARIGSAPPRAFVEACCPGLRFTGEDRLAYPALSASFESTVPGIHVIGALAGNPLIRQCLNQGYDVIEFIAGNDALKPADEPILQEKLAVLPGGGTIAARLDRLRASVEIVRALSPLQMRELMLDAELYGVRAGAVIVRRNDPGASLFAIVSGSAAVELGEDRTATIPAGSIFGEVGLISGRRRGATVRAAADTVLLEIPRGTVRRLMAQVPAMDRAITRISIERQLLQMFGAGLEPADLTEILAHAEIRPVRAGEAIIREGESGTDIFVIRSGSMIVEKAVGGKPIFLSYLPAGSYVGEMALIDGMPRSATVRAAIRSEVIRIDGAAFARLLDRHPKLRARAAADMASRRRLNSFIEDRREGFAGAVDLYSRVASFLVDSGIGEATDVLLIDERLCTGCDNCERACADSHDGLSRLDREAGRTFAHLHVPTSCRHCEHPHCMADCPPNAIHRGPDGEVFIDESCIGCGNCERSCPYGVIRMDTLPPKKPGLLSWMLFGRGPGPGEPDQAWTARHAAPGAPRKAIKCDMCSGHDGGPACVRACPTGAAVRVAPEEFLSVTRLGTGR